MQNFDELIIHNPEPYKSIYRFIKTEIMPKYPCLTTCFQDNFDEEGNPRVQYYIRYAADLTIKQEDDLYLKILRDIKEFCSLTGIEYNEDLDIDILLLIDGGYNERK
ncbi:hypothetical protein [Methanobrevibacter sp.]|uniref:hypothetical protein n=1 Tax=Methanobrevibacter sp. TaxID=66852 RepID=UPI00388EBCE6